LDCRDPNEGVAHMRGTYWVRRQELTVRIYPAAIEPDTPFPEEAHSTLRPNVNNAVRAGSNPPSEFQCRDLGFGDGRSV
jgi:hypothetical protein